MVITEVLLDAHALLWFDVAPEKLSAPTRLILQAPQTRVFVSALSAWELAIKYALGKLPEAAGLVQNFHLRLAQYQFLDLPFHASDALQATSLLSAHKDPFDRGLVAQCMGRQLVLVSADDSLDGFGISRLW